MESKRCSRRVGVVLAGVGGVGEAFVRILQQHFRATDVRVDLVAIGDSKGFVVANESSGLSWQDVVAIVGHKKNGHTITSWARVDSLATIAVLDSLTAVLHQLDSRRDRDDYVVVDCTSSSTIVPELMEVVQMGFALILANKLPVGGSLDQYQQLTRGGKRRVRFEATVGAGLPVISVVQRIVASGDSISLIQGGLSGTMTYILSAMNRGTTFSAGLKEVHQLGITENDPREDLSGADVARKMVILARELGLAASASDVEITPLLPPEAFALPVEEFMSSLHVYDDVFTARLEAARSAGCALAYIGTVQSNGRIRLGLEHVSPTSLFATTSSTEGVVSITSDWFPEPLTLRGTGAGAESTAAAVVGDLAAILQCRE